MLPKRERLRANEVANMLRNTAPERNFKSNVFSLRLNRNKKGYNRFAIVLSAKLGNAARRNAFRRRVYEKARSLHNFGVDTLLIVRRGVDIFDASQLRSLAQEAISLQDYIEKRFDAFIK